MRLDLGRQRAARLLRPRGGTCARAAVRRSAASTCGARARSRHPAAGALRAPASLIDAAWGFEPDSNPYVIDLYNQNYLLVARYTDHVNTAPYQPIFQAAGKSENLDNTEAKFQISFKLRLWTTDDRRWGVWAAYTQQNQWQVYNGDISRPFRETNYMPELFVSYRPGIDLGGGFQWNLLNVGYTHQSNGRSDTPLAQLGPDHRDVRVRARQLRPARQGLVSVQLQGRQPEHHRLLRLRQPDRRSTSGATTASR